MVGEARSIKGPLRAMLDTESMSESAVGLRALVYGIAGLEVRNVAASKTFWWSLSRSGQRGVSLREKVGRDGEEALAYCVWFWGLPVASKLSIIYGLTSAVWEPRLAVNTI